MKESSNNSFLWDGKNNPIGAKILSTFDGGSMGQQALKELGVSIDKYFASEIDKHAINVAMANHPNTIQIGDVTKVKGSDLPKIDLLIGGSPCQGFSFSGKQLNFDDPRSKLFFEFVRLKNELKPKYWLLENVVMKQEYQDVISEHLGVRPVKLNSGLIGCQNRERLYWCNWHIEQPTQMNISISDVLGIKQVNKKQNKIVKSIESGKVKVRKYDVDIERLKTTLKENKNMTIKEIAHKLDVKKTTVEHWFRNDGCFSIPDANIWQPLKELLNINTTEFDKSITEYEIKDNVYEMADRVYDICGKAPTLTASNHKIRLKNGEDRFNLDVNGFEMLQNLPIGYTSSVTEYQGKKICGNGWNVGMIKHIFKCLIRQARGEKTVIADK